MLINKHNAVSNPQKEKLKFNQYTLVFAQDFLEVYVGDRIAIQDQERFSKFRLVQAIESFTNVALVFCSIHYSDVEALLAPYLTTYNLIIHLTYDALINESNIKFITRYYGAK